ncbi:MAG: hypothetical protein ABI724_18205 [Betaproteobacteria bacterium]
MTRLVMLCFLTLLMVSPARGSAFSTDNSDLWLAHNEDGWGMQLVQRADIMFATVYVYSASMDPIYYTVTLSPMGTTPEGEAIWVGDLYLSRGPWFGSPTFNSSQVSRRIVGQLTYAVKDLYASTLTYSVEGVQVSKEIYRYTLRNDDYSGSYVGAFKVVATQCFDPASDAVQVSLGTFNVVSQSSSALRIVTNANQGFACTYDGDYQQFGQFGQSRGAFSCTDGRVGDYTFYEMLVTKADFRGLMVGENTAGCSLSGNFTGLRQ